MAEGINVTARGTVAAAVEAVQQDASKPAEIVHQAASKPDPKLDALEKKERWIRKMQKEVDGKRAEIEARVTEYANKDKEYSTNYISKNRLTEDPLTVLTEAGISYDKLTELLLNSPTANDPTIRALRNELQAIKKSQQDSEERSQQAVQAQYTQALGQIRLEVNTLISNNPEFETIKAAGMQEAVTELIEQTFNAEQYLMDIETAAREVENHLVEEGYKMSQLSKIKARLNPQTPKTEEPASSQRPQSQTIKTLTRAVNAQPSKRSSEKERIARAMAAFVGKS